MKLDLFALRLRAEWYRNGMHDIRRASTQNDVPPLTVQEIRQNVAGFEKVLFEAFEEARREKE